MSETIKNEESKSSAPHREEISTTTIVALIGLVSAVIVGLLGFLGSVISKHYEGQNTLQLKRQEFQTTLILQAIRTDDIDVSARNLSFFIEAGLLDDKDGKISEFLQDRQNIPILPTSRKLQKKVYESVQIEGITTDKSAYRQGETVRVHYNLVNRSDKTLVVPENRDFSQPFNLLGTIQHWIQRIGPDSTIPSIPKSIGRQGTRYAAGGTIVPTGTKLKPNESIPIDRTIDTKGYPSGQYRFYAEYKELAGSVIQTQTIDFTIE